MFKITDQQKKDLFPGIDFHAPNDDLRVANVRKLSYIKWLVFHYSAYKLVQFGSSIIIAITSGMMIYKSFVKENYFFTVIGCVLCFMGIRLFIKHYKAMKVAPYMNFYDIYLRDYSDIEDKKE